MRMECTVCCYATSSSDELAVERRMAEHVRTAHPMPARPSRGGMSNAQLFDKLYMELRVDLPPHKRTLALHDLKTLRERMEKLQQFSQQCIDGVRDEYPGTARTWQAELDGIGR